jgi:hypothetical protein
MPATAVIVAPIVVATPSVPVISPAWVPELTRAPLREGSGVGLGVDGDTHTRHTEGGTHGENRCNYPWNYFHNVSVYPAGQDLNRIQLHPDNEIGRVTT